MTGIITQQTAYDIWLAYREIDVSKLLIKEIDEAVAQGKDPTPLDAFGRRSKGFELGVPMSDASRRIFQVEPKLAKSVITAHIAEQEAILKKANERARIELAEPKTVGINPELVPQF